MAPKSNVKKKFKPYFLIVLALVIAVLIIFNPKAPVKTNVLLISVDTCRADHIGCYGFEKNTSPNIDRLASEGIVFEQAITPVAFTLPAHSSVMTGTYPPYHGIHVNFKNILESSSVTLAEMLNSANYETAGYVSTFVLNNKFGISQGFDQYDDTVDPGVEGRKSIERLGGRTCDGAIEYIRKKKEKPFFLFTHFYDPHTDYNPPEPFKSQFVDDPYSGEIAYVDDLIGKMIKELKAADLYDATLIIVMSDHGEGLGEHGELEHGYLIYQNTVQVPLVIKPPYSKKGKTVRVKEVVSLVDVMPTVLGYLGMEKPAHLQGVDLSLAGKKGFQLDVARQVYCEAMLPTKYGCNPLLGLVTSGHKYIDTTDSELYDLNEVPLEKNNLLNKDAKRAKVMKSQLQEMSLQMISGGNENTQTSLDQESLKKLESMGYVGGGVATSLVLDKDLPDPKDLLDYHEHFQQVLYYSYHHETKKVKKLLEKMMVEWPEIAETWKRAATLAYEEKKYAEAISAMNTYMQKLDLNGTAKQKEDAYSASESILPQNIIGKSYLALADYENAILNFKKAIQLGKKETNIYLDLGISYFELKQYQVALGHFLTFFKNNNASQEAHHNLAATYEKLENYSSALFYLNHLRDLNPTWPGIDYAIKRMAELDKFLTPLFTQRSKQPTHKTVHYQIAVEYLKSGMGALAVTYLEKQLVVDGNAEKTLRMISTVCYQQNDEKKAYQYWQMLLATVPDDLAVKNNLAWIMATTKNSDVRDPKKALLYAESLCVTEKSSGYLDTYSVALAANNLFDQAIEIAEKAISLAQADDNEAISAMRSRIALFKEQKSYYE